MENSRRLSSIHPKYLAAPSISNLELAWWEVRQWYDQRGLVGPALHTSWWVAGDSPLRREGLSIELKSCYFQRKDPNWDHLNSRQGPSTMWSPRRTRGRWSWYGQDPNQTPPEPTSQSDRESRRAEELMSTSIPVSTPQRGRGRGIL